MIPLYDINATRRTPWITRTLFWANVSVFAYQALLPSDLVEALMLRFGVVPAILTSGDLLSQRSDGGAMGALITPLTSLFLHGSLLHVASNMLFLHVFADNVEDVLGRARFVLFYFFCGLCGVVAQVAVYPSSHTPMIGASGAISGILAAYVIVFPTAPVVTLTPIFLLVEIPAFLFVFVWFAIQLLNGLTSLGAVAAGGGGVAWFAHVGGFAAGLWWMRRHIRRRREGGISEKTGRPSRAGRVASRR